MNFDLLTGKGSVFQRIGGKKRGEAEGRKRKGSSKTLGRGGKLRKMNLHLRIEMSGPVWGTEGDCTSKEYS